MRAWLTISSIILWGIITTTFPAMADELHLSNGDVISGQLIRMEENQLFFKTTYADEIKVNWSEVITLITNDSITVIFNDGKVVSGISQKASLT